MSSYYLTENTFICNVNRCMIFLDLQKDNYIGLGTEESNACRALLGDEKKPSPTDTQELNINKELLDKVAQDLINEGLITQDPTKGKTFSIATPPNPETDLIGYIVGKKPNIRFAHVIKVFFGALFSAARLRWQPLEKVILRVKKRKANYLARKAKRSDDKNSVDIEQIKELVEIFNRLSPLLFTSHNRCLYHALVLVEFLSAYDIYPDWVFGVKMGRFQAHCWLQEGSVILNDSAAHSMSYTPIMVV